VSLDHKCLQKSDAKQKELEELRRNSEQTRDRIRVIETKSEDAALEMAALALRYAVCFQHEVSKTAR